MVTFTWLTKSTAWKRLRDALTPEQRVKGAKYYIQILALFDGRLHLWLACWKIKNFWTYLYHSFSIQEKLVIYHMRNGLSVELRSGTRDHSMFAEVLLTECYRQPFPFSPQECQTIIDLGAHIGTSSLFFSVFFPQAKIIAIEPCPSSREILERNIQRNQLADRVTICPYALSDSDGTVSFFEQPGHSGRNSLFSQHAGSAYTYTVPCHTLAFLFADQKIQKCDLLKCDIEGGEYPVFYSSAEELKKTRCISMEHHLIKDQPTYNGVDLEQYLQKIGFSVRRTPGYLFANSKLS